MNFDPSVLIKTAALITGIGGLVGSYALWAEYRERKGIKGLSGKAKSFIGTRSNPPTVSKSSVNIGEIDASRMIHRV